MCSTFGSAARAIPRSHAPSRWARRRARRPLSREFRKPRKMPRSMCITRRAARAFVVVAIVAVAVEARIGAGGQQRRADLACRSRCPSSERKNQLRPAYAASILSARSASHGWPIISCETSALKCGSVTTTTSPSGGLSTGAAASSRASVASSTQTSASHGFGISSSRHPSARHSRPRCWPIVS